MYCKKCGDPITYEVNGKINPDLKMGEHKNCNINLKHCNQCGEKETPNKNHLSYGLYFFCQQLEEKQSCANIFF